MYSVEKIIVTKCETDIDYYTIPNYTSTSKIVQVPTMQHSSLPSGVSGMNPIPYTIHGFKSELRISSISNPSVGERKMIKIEDDKGQKISFEYDKELYDNLDKLIQSNNQPEIIVNKILYTVTSIEFMNKKYYNHYQIFNLIFVGGYTVFTCMMLYEVWQNIKLSPYLYKRPFYGPIY
jgi:hypothetical protein